MEEATPLHSPEHDRTGDTSPRPVALNVRPEQTTLPLDDGTGGGPRDLPADGAQRRADGPATPEHDRPIGFALTVRARRAVAPNTLPALRVVPDAHGTEPRPEGGSLDEPDDTRPARARALRRAGVPVSAIAAQLGADPLAITAWIGEIAPSIRRQGNRTAAQHAASPETPVAGGAPQTTPQTTPQSTPQTSRTTTHLDEEGEVAARLARAAAADQARLRLQHDAPFAVAAGLLAATATADRYAVTITTSDPRQASLVLSALRDELPDSGNLARVILRLGPSVAADLTRHRVATQLGLAAEQVAWTRWKAAPQPEAVQLLVRIAEPTVATTVAGWIEAVLGPSPGPTDLAF